MDSFGLKATVTAVLANDKYDIGLTYSDSDGRSFDKRYDGLIDDLEKDTTEALLELYLEGIKQQKSKKSTKSITTDSQKTEDVIKDKDNVTCYESLVDKKFAELEEENRRLNDKINSIITGHTSKPIITKKENKKNVKKENSTKDVVDKTSKSNISTNSTDDWVKCLRLLGLL